MNYLLNELLDINGLSFGIVQELSVLKYIACY